MIVQLLLALALGTPADLAKQFEHDIKIVAADDMEGRGLGTKGIDRAAAFLEGRLRDLKLQPAFGKSYRQPFDVKTGVEMGEGNRLGNVADDAWTPLGFSSSGKFHAPVVFVGYGIAAPPLGYDDYAGVDLKGKVALMLRYEPQEKDDKSVFDGRRPSRWSAMRYKVLQARERGAVAVVFTTGPQQDEGKDRIPALANDGPQSAAGIPVVQVKPSVAETWGINLKEFQDSVDKDLKPRSRVLPLTLDGHVNVKATNATTSNVAAILPGRGKLASDVVVIGAHYDHLGYGGEHSMKPNVHAIHNGADDNGSGTVAVLLIAQRMSELLKDAPERRTVLFALFSGEEMGLAGSGWMVDHMPVPMKSVVAMINLDMVGMLRNDELIAFGADSAPQWRALLEKQAEPLKLKLTERGDGYGPSDQTSFYAKQVPVIHFFTGTHERYHAPEDDAEFLNYAGAAKVVELTTAVADELALGRVTPAYARTTASAPAMEGDSRGYGAYLGTVPDYRAMEAEKGGVLLADVRAGGPADKAGIRGGDRLVEMAGTKIENLYDMTYALQDHRPGETIDVVVIRSEQPVKLRATLGTRGAPPPEAKAFEIKAGKPVEKSFDGEKHLKDIRQLTFGGENAEAYFSPDGTKIIYQATVPGAGCDQQYVMDLGTGENKLLSDGKGRTTCGYFTYPKGDRIVYASTESGGAECPPKPDYSKGYVWPVYSSFEIYEAKPDGSDAKRITNTPGYDAEMTWCHKGGKAIFTSMRDGDLDLYEWDAATGKTKRLTNTPGYDGGAFYNADCSEIVWRALHPTGEALAEYKALLAKDLVRPLHMELFLMNADGTNQRQVTSNGAANFCPYFVPDGKRILFASNVNAKGFDFDLWLVGKDGQNLERVTTAPGFDGFCVFSPDGKYLVWASSRAKPDSHEMNLFIAKWVE
ncbi:MAG TPA: M28 family peptidase [Thermoanaerobaculia bacterium]|nr:M28 family peptidase [Thermoanaerobaculia bacterium]